jgi:hypothetical protein
MLYICINSPPKLSDLGQDWGFILQWQHLLTNIACPIFFLGYWSVINRTYKCKLRPHRGTLFSNTYTKLFQILLSSSSKRLLSLPNNVWRLIVFAPFLIKSPNEVWWLIVFAPFLIIITSPRLLSGDVLLFYVSFSLLLLLLRHPERSRVTYCYSTFLFHYYYYSYYYYSSTHFCPLDFSEMPWSNFMKPFRNIICHVKLCW